MSNDTSTESFPRVNSARLPDYQGRGVRLIGKVETIDNSSGIAIVKASDGGEVRVKLLGGGSTVKDPCVEIIGNVAEPDLIKMLSCVNLGTDLDMSLADFVAEKWHDPKFANMF